MNDERHTFPGPGKSFYVLTLSVACVNCDSPPGVTIEQIKPGDVLYDEYRDGQFNDGPLRFEKWPDSVGVAIITGMRKHEFVKATQSHLVGVSSDEMGDNGRISKNGAEVILEEMYPDSWVKPKIVQPTSANR